MKDGERGKVLTTITRDDGQRGIHRSRTTHTDRCQGAEPTGKQWRAEQGEELTHDIGKQGHSAEGRSAVLRDEDTGKRVVAKSGANGEAVGQPHAGKDKTHSEASRQGATKGAERQ